MKIYSLNDVAKVLVKNGYEFAGWRGSHCKFRRSEITVQISRHSIINDAKFNRILKYCHIDINDKEMIK